MSKRNQKGPQKHAEGQHGEKTHARFQEQLREGSSGESQEDRLVGQRRENALKGGRRLVEDRQQHDVAEKNSEHTQLFVEHKLGRDDAEAHPESGYPSGRLTTKPSARPSPKDSRAENQAGSESEFDSRKPKSDADASF